MDIQRIRRFNRYYARVLGIFDRKFLGMDFSVTEVRILGEIGRNRNLTAKALGAYLNINKGYLSHVLQNLEKQELIWRSPSETDGRERCLHLTAAGEALNRQLEDRADQRILSQVGTLDSGDMESLLASMENIQRILTKAMPDVTDLIR